MKLLQYTVYCILWSGNEGEGGGREEEDEEGRWWCSREEEMKEEMKEEVEAEKRHKDEMKGWGGEGRRRSRCEYIYLQEKGLHERIRPITSAPPKTVSNTHKDGKKREIKGHKCTTPE